MVSQSRAESICRLEATLVMGTFSEKSGGWRSDFMTCLRRAVNDDAGSRELGGEFGHALDRDRIGGGEPGCGEGERWYLHIRRQQLQPLIRELILDNGGRNDRNAEAFDRHM